MRLSGDKVPSSDSSAKGLIIVIEKFPNAKRTSKLRTDPAKASGDIPEARIFLTAISLRTGCPCYSLATPYRIGAKRGMDVRLSASG
jgi:hypothetical protein